MNNINIHSELEPSPIRKKMKQFCLQDKLEMLKIGIEETQKYELLTTNQYLKQMELVIDILDELSHYLK